MIRIARRWRQILLTAVVAPLLVAAALWLELRLSNASGARFLFFAFSPAVALSALAGGFAPGACALLLSALASDYYLLGPGRLLYVSSTAEAVALSGFILAWLPMTILAERILRLRTRKESERVAATQAAAQAERLQQLTAALAKPMLPAGVIEACVQEAAHAFGAAAASFFLVDADRSTLRLARAIGYDHAFEEAFRTVPLVGSGPLADAVARRAPVVLESLAQREADYAGDALRHFRNEDEATVVLPLLGASGVVALLRLDFGTPCTFDADDREFLGQIAARAAQALERTGQYAAAQRARNEAERLRVRADQELQERLKIEQALRTSETRYRALAARTSRLHALTAALSEAVTVDAVARAVVQRGRNVVGATAADVARLVEDGAFFETLDADPPDNIGVRVAVVQGLCAAEAVATLTPVFVGSFDELQERYWRSAPAAADGGYASMAALPLVIEGTAIGVLCFHFTVPVNFDEEYQALLISVAQHCAQALDRARLYEAAQRARAEAEAANRLKDDFLSVVSHELRTPLTSILGWTTILQKPAIDAGVASRALQAVRDNAERQARLIDDLLDFSRISSGHLLLDRQRVNLHDVLHGVVETVLPVAAAKRVELRYGKMPAAVVVGDMRRLEQVFLNLLGNAVKFTPPDGAVELRSEIAGGWIEVCVRDTGAGIDSEFLPHVFDRFRQGDRASTRMHEGVGLGLSIAKQLVEAHGGTIAAQSDGPGAGSAFVVRLPSADRPVAPRAPAGASDLAVAEQKSGS